jgi:hypothetical protein
MTGNLRVLGLYLRSGLRVEGLRHRAVQLAGTAIDEYDTGQLLAPRTAPDLDRLGIPRGSSA